MPSLFETELREQPASLGRLLREGQPGVRAMGQRIRAYGARFAVLAARGSSDNAARYGQYLLGIRNRLVVSLATPSLFTQYQAAPSLAGALVIGISQSGRSPDVVEVVREGRRQGALTLALTNQADCPLAAAADMLLPLRAGPELSVAASKTYTAELAALGMLSAALGEEEAAWDEIARVPALVAEAIDESRAATRGAELLRSHEHLLVLSRGYNLATALEITLKVKEMSGVLADGYSSADFLHGPMAILDSHLPVLVVAPGPRVFADLDEVVRLARERGAPLVAISDRADVLEAATVALPLPSGVPEWLTPIVAVVPGQLWALALCLARGRQPDAPPGLAKVTETR